MSISNIPHVGNGTLKVNSWRRDKIRPTLNDNSEALREKKGNQQECNSQ